MLFGFLRFGDLGFIFAEFSFVLGFLSLLFYFFGLLFDCRIVEVALDLHVGAKSAGGGFGKSPDERMHIGFLAVADGFDNHWSNTLLGLQSASDELAGHGPGAFGAIGVGGGHGAIDSVPEAGKGIGNTSPAAAPMFGNNGAFGGRLEGVSPEHSPLLVNGGAAHRDVDE